MQEFKNLHANKRCFILANGPSLTEFDFSKIKEDDVVVGINASYELYQAQYQVFCDTDNPAFEGFLKQHGRSTVFALKFSASPNAWREYPGIQYVEWLGGEGWNEDLTQGVFCVGSGFLALRIACWLGCNPIYFVGLDCGEVGRRTRFNTTEETGTDHAGLRRSIEWAVKQAERRGYDVFNLSPHYLGYIIKGKL